MQEMWDAAEVRVEQEMWDAAEVRVELCRRCGMLQRQSLMQV